MVFSYSRIATWNQCQLKFKFAYVDKVEVERVPSPAMERGLKVHESIENFLRRENELLHPDIHENYGQFLLGIRDTYDDVRPEFKWAITWEFEPCDYNDPRAMLRGFVDCLIVKEDPIVYYEWKTGKYYPEHFHQALIYGVALMSHFPDNDAFQANITYLDQQDFRQVEYHRMMELEYKPRLRREIGEITDAKRYKPSPSFKCRWCPFSKTAGGPCHAG